MTLLARRENGAGSSNRLNGHGAPLLVTVFDEAPELLGHLSAGAAAEAMRLRVPLVIVEPGPWDPPVRPGKRLGHLGLLVLDGLLLRRVRLARRHGAELLGAGDLLQPWVRQPPYETLLAEPGWEVLERMRLAVLDGRFAARMAPYPEVAAAVVERAIERARALAFQQAASHITGLERRLMALFWALADRWGRVTVDGVLVPLCLTHAVLAELVGAARPSVSSAVSELAREGELERVPGGWLLRGEPPV